MLQRGSQEKRETICCCGGDDEPAFVIWGWGGIPRSTRWGLYYAGGGEEVGNTKQQVLYSPSCLLASAPLP